MFDQTSWRLVVVSAI